jgi:hypothetical protein
LPNAYLAITGGLLLDAIAQALLPITSVIATISEAMIAVFNEPPVENQINCPDLHS